MRRRRRCCARARSAIARSGLPDCATACASAHLVLMMVRHRHPDVRVYVFARHPEERAFALQLGAAWAGDTSQAAPSKLDAIIDTTPAWLPVIKALENLEP